MLQRKNRVLEHDPRTGKAHHFGNLFSVSRLVAVNLALGAHGLVFFEGTAGKSLEGIVRKFLTLRTQIVALGAVMGMTIDANHSKHCIGFALQGTEFNPL